MLIYRGFACLYHASDNEDELCDQIGNFSLNTDQIVSIYCGGAKRNFVKLSEWKQESTHYFNRFFSKRLNDIICVPQHGDIVTKTLKEWCQKTQKNHSQGALIVQNFDLLKQIKFFKLSRKKITKCKNLINRYPCYLVYNCSENVILYLWRGKDGKIKENLAEKIKLCISDIHFLVKLYQDELTNSGVRIIGIVISNTKNQVFNFKCKFCKLFVASIAVFENLFSFHPWWEERNRWFEISDCEMDRSNSKSFSLFSAKMLSLMACTDCTYLPNFTKNAAYQIEQLCLLLNPEQMDIIYSSNNHTILKGNFGTGKSIIIQKKLGNLIKMIEKNEVVYYFNYDRKSNAFIDVKGFIEKICPKNMNKIKIRENKDGLNLSGIFVTVLNEIERGIKCVHIFIDEFNGEDLTPEEIEIIKENLQVSYLKNAIVFIAAQPIENERTDTFDYPLETFKSQANLFHELEDIFQIEELTYVMRTTVQINTIVDLVQKYLKNKKNEFIYLQSDNKKTFTPRRLTNLNSPKPSRNLYTLLGNEYPQDFDFRIKKNNTTMKFPHKDSSNSQRELDEEKRANLDTPTSFESFAPSSQHTDEFLNLSAKRNKGSFMHGIDGLDQAFKESDKFEAGRNKTVTKSKTTSFYKFISDSEIGHKIESSNPKLIFPGGFQNEFENVISYSAVLNSLDIGKQRVVMVHFEQSPPSILRKALMNLSLPVSYNVQEFLRDKNTCTLVTNFQYIRGMEFENVIIVLDPEEYFLKQYLPEAVTRCTNNLALIMLEDKKMRPKDETVTGFVELLEQQDPPVVEKWITEKCKKCKRRSNYYCYKNDGNTTRIGINVLSGEFKKMQKYFNPIMATTIDDHFAAADAERM